MATPDTIWDRTYPSIASPRSISIANPAPPVDPKVSEFIRYILSREGMQAVADDDAYTPINEQVAQAQRHKLDYLEFTLPFSFPLREGPLNLRCNIQFSDRISCALSRNKGVR